MPTPRTCSTCGKEVSFTFFVQGTWVCHTCKKIVEQLVKERTERETK